MESHDPTLRSRLQTLIDEARGAGRLAELERLVGELLVDARKTEGRFEGKPHPSELVVEKQAAEDRGDAGSGITSPRGDKDSAVSDESPVTAAAVIPARFGMVGDSPPMRALFALLERVAPSDVSVLVHGETGTGKELVARALHDYGKRKKKPFLAENCAAVPANLLESELFGHKRGSFTGAVADRPGHFVAANGGTVFLDEIGDMPLAMQSKLLRVLQEGEVRAVGSNKTEKVDVRVVAATNKDLVAMCQQGSFRQDLYFRLNVVTITLPPLRDRAGDVVHLANAFLQRLSAEMGRPFTLTPEARAALEKWRWPGNVRELDNVLRRAVVFAKGPIQVADLPRPVGTG